jgi:hypothetical protein
MIHDISTNVATVAVALPYGVSGEDPTDRSTPTAHLSPNSKLIITEQYEWRNASGAAQSTSTPRRFKTGLIDIFDVSSRRLAATAQLIPVPGFAARVLGFSTDGLTLFVGSHDLLYAVNVADGGRVTGIPLQGLDGFWTVGLTQWSQ